jgi:hypothetical protein
VGVSNSWKPLGLNRPEQELLSLYLYVHRNSLHFQGKIKASNVFGRKIYIYNKEKFLFQCYITQIN